MRITLTFLFTAVVVLVVRLLCPGEPFYQGKPLTFWLGGDFPDNMEVGLDSGNQAEREQARVAVQAMGNTALPYMVQMIAEKPWAPEWPTRSSWSRQLLRKSGFEKKLEISRTRAYHRRRLAEAGFEVLRADAAPAVPALIRLLEDPSEDVRGTAATCLGHVGAGAREAVPALLAHLDDVKCTEYDKAVRRDFGIVPTEDERLINADLVAARVERALARIPHNPAMEVPSLIEFLRKPADGSVFYRTLLRLAKAREEAESAVPAIVPLLNHRDWRVRNAATNALTAIGGRRNETPSAAERSDHPE
jgi:HEAT repeat protein